MRFPRPFRYARDPVCMTAVVTYALNRWMLKPHGIGGALAHDYLNDVLCLPLFLPVILWVQRRIGLRRHDAPPRAWEIAQHWAVFSVLFEVVLPLFPQTYRTTADPWDVVAYAVGGGLAAWIWRGRGRVKASAGSGRQRAIVDGDRPAAGGNEVGQPA